MPAFLSGGMPGQDVTLSQPACRAGPRGVGPQAHSEATRGGRPGTQAAATRWAFADGGGGQDACRRRPVPGQGISAELGAAPGECSAVWPRMARLSVSSP